MAKQEQFGGEQPEGKIETPLPSDKKESSIDAAYFSSVSRYFNRRKEDWMADRENPSEEDLQYEQFLSAQQNVLGKVANAKQLEKLQPKDVSFALSELAGMMASNWEQDPNSTIDEKKEYLEAKEIFMATCKKMFPEIESEASSSIFYIEAEKLIRLGISAVSVSMSEGGKLLKENPKELTKRINNILHTSGDAMKSYAFYGFIAEDVKETEAMEKKLGMGVISLYKLQLMRDRLTEKIYGRADITPGETRQIDEAREKV